MLKIADEAERAVLCTVDRNIHKVPKSAPDIKIKKRRAMSWYDTLQSNPTKNCRAAERTGFWPSCSQLNQSARRRASSDDLIWKSCEAKPPWRSKHPAIYEKMLQAAVGRETAFGLSDREQGRNIRSIAMEIATWAACWVSSVSGSPAPLLDKLQQRLDPSVGGTFTRRNWQLASLHEPARAGP